MEAEAKAKVWVKARDKAREEAEKGFNGSTSRSSASRTYFWYSRNYSGFPNEGS